MKIVVINNGEVITRKQVRNKYFSHCYRNKFRYYALFAAIYVGEWSSAIHWYKSQF